MLRSLYAGVSGMRAEQTRMDVIGNNIANVNTTGFKLGRVTFADQLSQTNSGAGAPTSSRGGLNGQQVGLGVAIGSIDTVMTQGSLQNTGRATDLALQGNGFFVLSDGPSQSFTRAGGFDFDSEGNLEVPGSGLKAMGWMASKDAQGNSTINPNAPLEPLKLPLGAVRPPQATTTLSLAGNLNAATPIGSSVDTSAQVYDEQGNSHLMTVRYTHAGANAWQWSVVPSADMAAAPTMAGGALQFDGNGLLQDPTGQAAQGAPLAVGHVAVTWKLPDGGTSTSTITPAMGVVGGARGLTQFADASTVVTTQQNGGAAGQLTGVTIGRDGVLHGVFSNGQTEAVGQLAIATFANPGGLMKDGGNAYLRTANSGDPAFHAAGTGEASSVSSGELEMSNVDLGQQFADLIVTQRGFQAASRMITTSDELLQELINLKH